MLYLIYSIIIIVLGLYSFVLVDPNITFVQNRLWVSFRDIAVQIGYYQRETSWYIFLSLVVLLFAFHLYFVKKYREISVKKIAFILGAILLISYPFLSHDFFNYMFDAKILTYYHQNPYLQRALDYPADQWTRFMHWTHRTYPYGPVFLLLSLIPSFLGFGKFTLSFLLFKAFFILCYGTSVYLLNKLNKKWAIMFATHPLIIIEGLVSSHNDIVALALGIIGIYFVFKKKRVGGILFFLFSAGIKYITVPLIFLFHKRGYIIAFLFQLFILAYLSFKMEVQPWYFLALFAFLPFYDEVISSMNIFFFGLLMSYYPYIRLGGWDTAEKVNIKHQIILVFFLINLFYFGLTFLLKRYKSLYNVVTRK
ncbi:hypothetical protein HZC27_02860 [Candidatus Roizmanbacteria bacterium]|nr:hypothetical protein [Candidatus Roizmanbacteria bacterium]